MGLIIEIIGSVWAQQCGGSIVYTRDQLLSLVPTALTWERPEINRGDRKGEGLAFLNNKYHPGHVTVMESRH